jgi:hypothetical protein
MSDHRQPLFRDADLSKRYGRTPRTINEWKRKKILPPPDMAIQDRDWALICLANRSLQPHQPVE